MMSDENGTACLHGVESVSIREVSAPRTSYLLNESNNTRIDVVRRSVNGPMYNCFRQPAPALLWIRRGVRRIRLDMDNEVTTVERPNTTSLVYIPANTTMRGAYVIDRAVDYTCILFPTEICKFDEALLLKRPLVHVNHKELERSVEVLTREAHAADKMFDLLAESWALQAIVYLSRLLGVSQQDQSQFRGGLSNTARRRVEEFMLSRLTCSMSIGELANIAALGPRHFTRAFHQSFGTTPMRYVMRLRIEEAKRQLMDADKSITDIALSLGFSHAQHLTTAFKNETGLPPSAYRHSVLELDPKSPVTAWS